MDGVSIGTFLHMDYIQNIIIIIMPLHMNGMDSRGWVAGGGIGGSGGDNRGWTKGRFRRRRRIVV